MLSVSKDWNPNQKQLALLLNKPDVFMDAIALCLNMHHQLHDLSLSDNPTIFQDLIKGLSPEIIKHRPKNSFSSIAWNIWHITRIEDAVSNILIANSQQILNADWLHRLGVSITDTGNAFCETDVDNLNTQINATELLSYRKSVGENTQKILKKLTLNDRKRIPTSNQLARILFEGVLTKEPDSIWLLEFWSRKTISGLLTMPITRHQIVHLNDCFKLKKILIESSYKKEPMMKTIENSLPTSNELIDESKLLPRDLNRRSGYQIWNTSQRGE